MAWLKVTHREPVLSHGGGEIRSAIATAVQDKIQEIHDFIEAELLDAIQTAVENWPIGPRRASNLYGGLHSAFRFELVDQTRGFYIRFEVENPADYAQFIHDPGSSDLVWERELVEALEQRVVIIREGIIRILSGELV